MEQASAVTIGVFDLNAADLAVTAGAVREYQKRGKVPADIREFSEIPAFAYDFNVRHYDMVFIGVDSMMGVEAARLIRQASERCPLFLVSSSGDYGIEGFRLGALDYLIKPVLPERVEESVKRAE